MSTNFPTSLDSYAAIVDGTDILEASDQNNARDAIEALEAKVGIDSSAVATSHDYKIAALEAGILNASGATVFNTTMSSANAFQDLDLSGTVGTKVARCLFEVYFNGNVVYQWRPNGYGGTWAQHYGASYSSPCNVSGDGGTAVYSYFMLDTDASGIIEHGCSSAAVTITLKLINWMV